MQCKLPDKVSYNSKHLNRTQRKNVLRRSVLQCWIKLSISLETRLWKITDWPDHTMSGSFVFSGCFPFNGTTFLDHTKPIERNVFYYFLFLSLISNRSENLMKRSRAAKPVSQNGTAKFRLTGSLGQTAPPWNMLLVCGKCSFHVYEFCHAKELGKLDAWNMLLIM